MSAPAKLALGTVRQVVETRDGGLRAYVQIAKPKGQAWIAVASAAVGQRVSLRLESGEWRLVR